MLAEDEFDLIEDKEAQKKQQEEDESVAVDVTTVEETVSQFAEVDAVTNGYTVTHCAASQAPCVVCWLVFACGDRLCGDNVYAPPN